MRCAYAGHTSNILKSDFVSLFAEEEGGDLVQPGISFPGPAKEDLGRVHTSAAQRDGRSGRGRRARPSPVTLPAKCFKYTFDFRGS